MTACACYGGRLCRLTCCKRHFSLPIGRHLCLQVLAVATCGAACSYSSTTQSVSRRMPTRRLGRRQSLALASHLAPAARTTS